MPASRMFGIETEFAFAAFARNGSRIDNIGAMQRLMEIARRKLPCLPGRSSAGLFLSNGTRLYIDCKKPEFTTPECTNPWDAARYGLACERMLCGLTDEYRRENPDVLDAVISNVNVSYGSWASTWASHESYGHRSDPTIFPDQLIPHLVSRLIYTGAGGFDNRSPGVEFLLSPRVAHLVRDISGDSTSNRGIFHTKNESLAARGYSRLHLLCGESVCSVRSRFLRMGTTALIVALIEAGCAPGRDVRLKNPLAAMQAFAADPLLQARAELGNGTKKTALEIQRHFLEQVRRHQTGDFVPAWAPAVCDVWEQSLDRLAGGLDASSQTFDWAIKLALFQEHAASRAIPWSEWPRWTALIRSIASGINPPSDEAGTPVRVDSLLLASSPPGVVEVAECKAREQNRTLDELKNALRLRQELFEIDTRFGQLDDRGLFVQLDAAGVLDHRVPGVDNIEHAVANPPADGRARLRGEVIRRNSGRSGFSAEWSGVWDGPNRKFLDLSDPFVSQEIWRDEPQPAIVPNPLIELAPSLLQRVLTTYDRGDYETASQSLDRLATAVPQLRPVDRQNYLRYRAWLHARRGLLDANRFLDELAREHPMNMSLVCDFLNACRYRGLAPPPETQAWIDRGWGLLQTLPDADPGGTACFLGHMAYTQLRWGRIEEAWATLDAAWQRGRYQTTHPHTQSRLNAERGEALRLLGQLEEATACLAEAEQVCTAHNFEGDLADFTLTYQAKLCGQAQPVRAFDLLEGARLRQVRLKNRLGEARTLLLQVRLPRRMWVSRKVIFHERTRARLEELRTNCPALANCTQLRRVLDQWTDWTSGKMPEGEADFYWKV